MKSNIFVFCLVGLLSVRGFGDETVVWKHSCDSLQNTRSGENVTLSVDATDSNVMEGSGSLKVVLNRAPGLMGKGWSGWFSHSWDLPKVPLAAGTRFRCWYKVDAYEPKYPFLWIKLFDTDGTSKNFRFSHGKKGKAYQEVLNRWVPVDIPLGDESVVANGGDGVMGPAVRLEVIYNYKTFIEIGEYTRWFDQLEIVDGDGVAKGVKPGKGKLDDPISGVARRIQPAFPVLFVPQIAEFEPDAELTNWRDVPPLDQINEQKDIAHSLYNSWGGADDFSSVFWAGWNRSGLHLATTVTDDVGKFEFTDTADFKDCDNWRIYIDPKRTALRKGEDFQGEQYVLAVIADSPAGAPMMKQVSWKFHEDPVEAHLSRIRLAGASTSTGWNLDLAIPAKALPGLDCKPNRVLTFGGSWQDTDGLSRKTELFWPEVLARGADDFWRKFGIYGDLVLMGDGGAFTYRSKKAQIARGEVIELEWCGVNPALGDATVPYELECVLKGTDGKDVKTWNLPIKLEGKPVWMDVILPTKGVDDGRYEVFLTLHRGQEKIVDELGWPIQISREQSTELAGEIRRQLDELNAFVQDSPAQFAALRKQGLDPAYPEAQRGVIQFCIPTAQQALQQDELFEARRLTGELMEVLRKAKAELADASQWLGPWRKVPEKQFRFGEGELTWNDGAFRAKGRPFYFLGFTSDIEWKTAELGALGFNAAHPNNPYRHFMPEGPDQQELTPESRERFEQRFELFEESGFCAAPMNLCVGTAPPKWLTSDEELSAAAGHFIPYCIESDESAVFLENYYKMMISAANEQDAVGGFLLLNEPTYEGKTELFKAGFRQWLQAKYQTIAALNAEWQENYPSFDQVPCEKMSASIAARRDWADYNRLNFSRHVRLLHGFHQKYDTKGRPDHIKPTTRGLYAADAWCTGVDWQEVSEITDLAGFDASTTHEPMMTDFMWSMGENKTLINSEYHMHWKVEDGGWAALWQSAAHGCDSFVFWEWKRPERIAEGRDAPVIQPYCFSRVVQAGQDLQRLAPELLAISSQPREIAILYSYNSIAFETEVFFEKMKEAYDGLLWSGAPIRYLTERQVQAGGLSGIKMLVVPSVNYTDGQTQERIADFAAAGGQVVLIDDCFKFDSAGRAQAVGEWRSAVTVSRVNSAEEGWKDPAHRLFWLDERIEQAGVSRPVRVLDEHNRPVYGVDVLSGSGLVSIAPMKPLRDGAVLRLVGPKGPATGLDLLTNQRVGGTLSLKQFEPMLIRLD